MLCNFTKSFFFFVTHQTRTSHLTWVWDEREVTMTVTHHIWKQQQWLSGYSVFRSDEEVAHLTPATEIILLLLLVIILSATTQRANSPKRRSCVSVRRGIQSSEDNVLLWGVRCHSLPGVGHTFFSLLWWISPPKASRRPLGAERLPVGIFLTASQGSFCFCCVWDPSTHVHTGALGVRGWCSPGGRTNGAVHQ